MMTIRLNSTTYELSAIRKGSIYTFTAGCKSADWNVSIIDEYSHGRSAYTLPSKCNKFSIFSAKHHVRFIDHDEADGAIAGFRITRAEFESLLAEATTHSKPGPNYHFKQDATPFWGPEGPRGFLIAHGDISRLTLNDFVALQKASASNPPAIIAASYRPHDTSRLISTMCGDGAEVTLLTPKAAERRFSKEKS